MPYPSDTNDSWDHFYDDEKEKHLWPEDLDEVTGTGFTEEDYEDFDDWYYEDEE